MSIDNLIFASIILILILIFYYYGKYIQQMNQFSGFYESDIEFNKESGISFFSFYIGNNNTSKYNGYLLMINKNNEENDNILINESVEFRLCSDLNHNINDLLYNNRNLKFTLEFYNLETKLFPNFMYIDFYPITNKIVLYQKGNINKIYAVFYKNSVLSEIEQISKESNNFDKKENNKLESEKGYYNEFECL